MQYECRDKTIKRNFRFPSKNKKIQEVLSVGLFASKLAELRRVMMMRSRWMSLSQVMMMMINSVQFNQVQNIRKSEAGRVKNIIRFIA